ncbi:hypothetical protein IQ07DRAFT_271088 [Pyrenochaeta sp. DS3sAY3a]|nr:hypothetical protein IQ07DRAFT_271088 [Pyrenochaeta sp. DS3sAY3a]
MSSSKAAPSWFVVRNYSPLANRLICHPPSLVVCRLSDLSLCPQSRLWIECGLSLGTDRWYSVSFGRQVASSTFGYWLLLQCQPNDGRSPKHLPCMASTVPKGLGSVIARAGHERGLLDVQPEIDESSPCPLRIQLHFVLTRTIAVDASYPATRVACWFLRSFLDCSSCFWSFLVDSDELCFIWPKPLRAMQEYLEVVFS